MSSDLARLEEHLPAFDKPTRALRPIAPPPSPPIQEMVQIAELLARSGYYKDIKDASQAFAKMLRGWELGIGYAASLTDIHIVQGKPELSSVLMAAKIKESEKYDYRVIVLTPERCEIAFFEWGEKSGTTSFTKEDAQRAGLAGKDNYKAWAEDMMFARAMSRGARRYCPDVFRGSVYGRGELEPDYPKPLPQAVETVLLPAGRVDTKTGEILPPAHARASAALPPKATVERITGELPPPAHHPLTESQRASAAVATQALSVAPPEPREDDRRLEAVARWRELAAEALELNRTTCADLELTEETPLFKLLKAAEKRGVLLVDAVRPDMKPSALEHVWVAICEMEALLEGLKESALDAGADAKGEGEVCHVEGDPFANE